MPSGGSKTLCLPCARHGRLDFKVQPRGKWTQEAQSFVTQLYLTINCCSWKRAGCLGEFVKLLTFSQAVANSFQLMVTLTCRVLPGCLKPACILFALNDLKEPRKACRIFSFNCRKYVNKYLQNWHWSYSQAILNLLVLFKFSNPCSTLLKQNIFMIQIWFLATKTETNVIHCQTGKSESMFVILLYHKIVEKH